MKKKFKEIKTEVISFDDADIITSSGLTTDGSYNDGDLGNYFDFNKLFEQDF